MSLKDKTIAELIGLVEEDWANPYFGAVPYIKALRYVHKIDPRQVVIGHEYATGVILYFLSNTRTWKGDIARAVKAELKARIK